MSEQSLPKILCVDDQKGMLEKYVAALAGTAECVLETTLHGAASHSNHLKDFALVILDGCIETTRMPPDGTIVSLAFRKAGYKGPIIAASGDDECRQILLANGCTHEADSKADVPRIVATLLRELASAQTAPTVPSTSQANGPRHSAAPVPV